MAGEMASPMAETSRRGLMRLLVSVFVILGVFLLAVSAILFNVGNQATINPSDQQNLQGVWSPVVWNLGMFLLLVGLFGVAVSSDQYDPLARLLIWIVALIAILMLLTGGATLFQT